MLWGTVTVAVAMIYQYAPEATAVSIVFWRLLFSLPLLLGVMHARQGWTAWRLVGAERWLIPLLGVSMACCQTVYFAAVPVIGVTTAAFVGLCVPPVLVALVSVQLFGERLTGRLVIALLVALCGVTLLVGVGKVDAIQGVSESHWYGVGLALMAALCYSSIVIIGRALAPLSPPSKSLGLGFGLSVVLLLPVMLWQGVDIQYDIRSRGLIVHLGIIATGVAYLLFFRGLGQVSATAASIITLIEPLVASMLAVILLGEVLTISMICGAVLLILAVVILGHQHKTADSVDLPGQ